MITVSELITRLQELPPDRGVVLAIDAEGNQHTPVVGVSEALWDQDPHHAWIGEAHSADPADYADPEDDPMPDFPAVAVIEPLN